MPGSDISDVPDDIERVIEGVDNRDVSDKENEEGDEKKEDENNKEKDKIRKRTGPRIVLNPTRLKGPRGIGIMESFFSDIKLHGKGREREDLDLVMQRLEHWTHRLIPRMQFDDCLKKIEKLGSKKEIANYVKRIRLGMEDEDVPNDVMQDDAPDSPPPIEDPFDQLINSTSQPPRPTVMEITTEQREQILRNRLLAEERRAARIKKAQEMKEKFLATQSQSFNSPEPAVPEKSTLDHSIDNTDTTANETNLTSENLEITEKTLGIQPESDLETQPEKVVVLDSATSALESELTNDDVIERSTGKISDSKSNIVEHNDKLEMKNSSHVLESESNSIHEEMIVDSEEDSRKGDSESVMQEVSLETNETHVNASSDNGKDKEVDTK